jgi:hypothetical protein
MKISAKFEVLSIVLLAVLAFVGKVATFCLYAQIDIGIRPGILFCCGHLADAAFALLSIFLLVFFAGVLERLAPVENSSLESKDKETTMRVKAPKGRMKVVTQVTLESDSRPVSSDSSEFELDVSNL